MTPRHIITADGKAILSEDPEHAHLDKLAREFFDNVGREEFFHRLCSRFYQLIFQDDLLSPLFESAPADEHARRLARHFIAMYGNPDLTEGWSMTFVRAHTHRVLSHEHRAQWLSLMPGADGQT